MREIKFRAKPDKACFSGWDNVPTTGGFVFGTPDTRMLWRAWCREVAQGSRNGWPARHRGDDARRMACVGYDNDAAAFCLYHPDGRHGGTLCSSGGDAAIKVVGNRYDNPELIKVRKV